MKINKKNAIKIFLILLFSVLLLSTQCSAAALNPDDYKPGTVTTSDAQSFIDKAGVILGAIRTFGVVLSVVVLMFIGIKYMMGSVEEKADYKKAMIPYVIGVVLLFATTTLVSVIFNWANGIA